MAGTGAVILDHVEKAAHGGRQNNKIEGGCVPDTIKPPIIRELPNWMFMSGTDQLLFC